MKSLKVHRSGIDWFVVRRGKIKDGDLVIFPSFRDVNWAHGLVGLPVIEGSFTIVLRPRPSQIESSDA